MAAVTLQIADQRMAGTFRQRKKGSILVFVRNMGLGKDFPEARTEPAPETKAMPPREKPFKKLRRVRFPFW
jgi:hypothetical protein